MLWILLTHPQALHDTKKGGLVHENEAIKALLPENKRGDTSIAIKDDVFLFFLKWLFSMHFTGYT